MMAPQRLSVRTRIRALSTWIADHEPTLLVGILPILIVSPSSAIPRWLELATTAVVAIVWLARRVAWGVWTKRTPLDLVLFLFFVVNLVSALFTVDPSFTWFALKGTILGLVIFYAVVNHVRSARALELVVALFLVAGLTAGLVGVLGSSSSSGRLLALGFPLPLGLVRLPALNPGGFNKNIWGGSVAMVIPLAVWLCRTGSAWRKALMGALALILAAICVLGQSRGALAAVLVGIWVTFLLRSRIALVTLPIAAAGAFLAVRRWGGSQIAEYLLSSDALGGWESRIEVWSRAVYMIRDFPFTGIGVGNFSRIAPAMYPYFLLSSDAAVPHAHQMFLQIAVDVGLLGLASYGAALILFMAVSWQTLRLSEGTSWQALAYGLFGGFVVYVVHGMIDYITLSTKPAAVIWTAMGLMLALWGYLRSGDSGSVRTIGVGAGDGERIRA